MRGPIKATPEAWKTYLMRIWDILVVQAAASAEDMEHFLIVGAQYQDGRMLEYRFCGKLGFGGKVWINNGRKPYVTCYPENETPERMALIKHVDQLLAAIHEPGGEA